ncbi:MAG: sugar ABC transporter substrate-binding protein [Lachnospiraceae bacterium]|nr:sugar ABC transporter substrate-binding protein [Lachnospiraceae bacterium]
MKRKLLATILCASMALATLAGCGGNTQTASTDAPAAETKTEEAAPAATEEAAPAEEEAPALEGEIHYAYWSDVLGPYLEECKANFEAANPGVTIVLEPTAWGEYWTKLETAATGGAVADVFQMNGPNIGKYASAGIIVPIDDLVANSDLDLNNYPQAMTDLYTVDGNLYGIAIDYDTIGLWYNKELFDAAGVEYPTEDWTWDDLVAAAEKLTDSSKGVYGMVAGYADQGGFYNTVPMSGGYILNDDKSASGFKDPATRAGIQCWVDLIEKGYSPSQASLTENADYIQFMSGKVAMLYAGDWFAATFVQDADFAKKIDCQYLPKMNGKRVSVIHGKANCISSATKYPEAAWAWVEYLAGKEANEILGKSGAAIPSYKGCADLYFAQFPDYNMGIFADEAENMSIPYPASKTSAEWGDIMWNELIAAYSGDVSVDEACDNIAEQMDALLASE